MGYELQIRGNHTCGIKNRQQPFPIFGFGFVFSKLLLFKSLVSFVGSSIHGSMVTVCLSRSSATPLQLTFRNFVSAGTGTWYARARAYNIPHSLLHYVARNSYGLRTTFRHFNSVLHHKELNIARRRRASSDAVAHPSLSLPLTMITSMVMPSPSMAFTSSTVHSRRSGMNIIFSVSLS